MNKYIESLSEFLSLSEKLKVEKRQSKNSEGEQDMVASHVWRVSLIVLSFSYYIDEEYDRERSLKMAIIHDLGEVIAGDIGIENISNSKIAAQRQEKEYQAFLFFQKFLSCSFGDDIVDLWKEFEENSTFEAKIVNAADKLEALLQNIEGNVSDPVVNQLNDKSKALELFQFNSFVRHLADNFLRRYHEGKKRSYGCSRWSN